MEVRAPALKATLPRPAPKTLTVALALLLLQKEVEKVLPPFIIEQIRRREEEERARHEQPQLELPIERPTPRAPQAPDEKGDRGVVIIDLMTDSV
jgi:hypothetical protein